MHQDLIRAKTGLPLDFEWLGARNNVLNAQFGAVCSTRSGISDKHDCLLLTHMIFCT